MLRSLLCVAVLSAAGLIHAQEIRIFKDDHEFAASLAKETGSLVALEGFADLSFVPSADVVLDTPYSTRGFRVFDLDTCEKLECDIDVSDCRANSNHVCSANGELIVRPWADEKLKCWVTLGHLVDSDGKKTVKARDQATDTFWRDVQVSADGCFLSWMEMDKGQKFARVDPDSLKLTEFTPDGFEAGQVFRMLKGGHWIATGPDEEHLKLRRYLRCDEDGLALGTALDAGFLDGGLNLLGATADGRRYAFFSGDKLSIWSLEDDNIRLLQEIEMDFPLGSVAISNHWLAVAYWEEGIQLYEFRDGSYQPHRFVRHPGERKWNGSLGLIQGRDGLLVAYTYPEQLFELPLGAGAKTTLNIGDDSIVWEYPQRRPALGETPELHAEMKLSADEGGYTCVLTAHNSSVRQAFQVKGQLHFGQMTREDREFTLHFGSIPAGESVRRALRVPASLLHQTAAVVHFDLEDFMQSPSRSIEQLLLPNALKTEEEYHARARLVFETGLEILRELTGKKDHAVKLESMTSGFGFTCGSGFGDNPPTVSYQNPWKMWEYSLRVNRDVAQVSDRDELQLHMQMMLYWYIPHELVHAFHGALSGWPEEYIANTIQPYLTERILKKIDAPYTAALMRKVYDRYTRVLRAEIKDDEAAAIERFALSDGTGGPFERSAWEVFQESTALYVYFGARINQNSLLQGHKLEDLVSKYLK